MVALRSTLAWSTPRPELRAVDPRDPDGFDLSDPEHYALVRKVYHGRFSERVKAAGIDTEDGLQTVLEGVHRRSQSTGGSRWDPSRGSISTWLTVAISGLVINLVDQHQRAARRNGVLGGVADVAGAAEDAEGMVYSARATAPPPPPAHSPRTIRRPRVAAPATIEREDTPMTTADPASILIIEQRSIPPGWPMLLAIAEATGVGGFQPGERHVVQLDALVCANVIPEAPDGRTWPAAYARLLGARRVGFLAALELFGEDAGRAGDRETDGNGGRLAWRRVEAEFANLIRALPGEADAYQPKSWAA